MSRTPLATIAAVERDVGVTKDTLRIWERRYGFPCPLRSGVGDRLYPAEQIERLRLIKRLVDGGHRPGRVVALEVPALLALCAGGTARSTPPPEASPAELLDCIALLKRHELPALLQALDRALPGLGMVPFVTELLAPLIAEIGNAWARGELAIFEEHLLSQRIRVLLRQAIEHSAGAAPWRRPRALLTTFPGEVHGLGIAMVEAMLAHEGAACLSLGTQTPVRDIAHGCAQLGTDLVCLSATSCMNGPQLLAWLGELRAAVPATVQVWAGGSATALHRRPIEGVHVFADLRDVPAALKAWRDAHG